MQINNLFEPMCVFDHIQPRTRGFMLKKIFPFLKWPISKETVRADFIAGLTKKIGEQNFFHKLATARASIPSIK